jgi:hypothetical protein
VAAVWRRLSLLSAWWDTAHTIVRRAHLDADLSWPRRMAPLESTLRLVGFGAHDCAPHAHLDADLRRTVAPFSRGRRMAPLESTRRSLSGTDETVGAFLAPTRRSEPFWHRRDGRSLSGTDETVGAFLAPAVRSEPFWHRRDGRRLSGTDGTVGAFLAPTRRSAPIGTDETFLLDSLEICGHFGSVRLTSVPELMSA